MQNRTDLKIFIFLLCFIAVSANEPSSPDFTSYSAVGNNELVNKFTGDFNYSIPIVIVPGPDGSEYRIALNYQSGVQPDQQASWVGYGWSLSPGSITRQKKGLPDDFKAKTVKYWQKFRPSLTASKNFMVRGELLSKDDDTTKTFLQRPSFLSGTFSRSTMFNNHGGYSVQTTVGAGAGAFGSLSATWDQKGVPTWMYDVNIASLLGRIMPSDGESTEGNDAPKKKTFLENSGSRLKNTFIGVSNSVLGSRFLYNAFTNDGSGRFPTSTSEYGGYQSTFNPSLGVNLGYARFEAEPGITITKIEQYPIEQPIKKTTYGYINTHNSTNDKDILDYYTEKQMEFTKDSKFLPIPFSNADNFYVNCQGLSGSFRAWSRFVEEYRPNQVVVSTPINNYGVSGAFGIDGSANLGFSYANGENKNATKGWMSNVYNDERDDDISKNGVPRYYFKFHNDLADNISFYNSNEFETYLKPEALDVVKKTLRADLNNIYNITEKRPNSSNIKFRKDVLGSHNNLLKTSKAIRANYNGDLQFDTEGLAKFSKNSNIISGVSDELITEFKVTDENGRNYVFGQPVFSRNEKSLSYGISELKFGYNSKAYTEDNKIVYHNITPEQDANTGAETKIVMGQEVNEPYASSYLLTEILSTNYVDMENDGPTIDDLGGYTLFDYERVYGSDNKSEDIDYDWDANGGTGKGSTWYKWRAPIGGFYYNRGEQSNNGDDVISFSSGEKEIYNMVSISTKTHVAFFINNKTFIEFEVNGELDTLEGTGAERKDGFESYHYEWQAGKSKVADFNTENNLRYLEEIQLWKLDETEPFRVENGKRIYNVVEKLQTTNFSYNYEAWEDHPSSEDDNGKLTLKQVWTETGEDKTDLHSPYVFDYDYSNFPSSLSSYEPNNDETPDYNTLNIDAWGNYRPDDISEVENGRNYQEQSWVYQNRNVYTDPSTTYDPSAWNLKQITLPSNGKIFIDYEEKEYTNVQDESPLVMMSLTDNGYSVFNKLIFNVKDSLGINDDQVDDIVNEIQNRYVDGDEKIYFNFLYALVGPNAFNDISSSASEYIDGFVKVSSVIRNGSNIEIIIDNSTGEFVPRKICRDYYYAKKYGLFSPDMTEKPALSKVSDEGDFNNQSVMDENIGSVVGKLGTLFFGSDSHTANEGEICKDVNTDLSYVRIPLPRSIPKKGGGVRVEKVLYVDEFNTKAITGQSTPRIYGNEYVYKNTDGFSSGVASNEPSAIKRENPYYKPIVKRNSSSVYSAGQQVQNLLGPFGESILPSPGIGYSRVISKSIVDNMHHPGFTIDSFLTYKEYPVYGSILKGTEFLGKASSSGEKNKEIDLKGFSWTSLNEPLRRYIKDPGFTAPIPYVRLDSRANASQGFQFVKHNFNGKPVKSVTYGGRFDDDSTWNEGSRTEYEYFGIGELVPAVNSKYKVYNSRMGVDEEIVMEGRQTENTTYNWGFESDISIMLGTFLPYEMGGFGNYSKISRSTKTHTTNKIVSYPAIAKKVTTYADGVTTVKEHVAFDENTGQPFVTKVNDKFADADRIDSYYEIIDIPTSYIKEAFANSSKGISSEFMGKQKMTESITRKIRDVNGTLEYFINIDAENFGGYSYEFIRYFSEGDLIRVTGGGYSDIPTYAEYYRITRVLSDALVLEPILGTGVQSYGESDMPCNVEIIESGRQNLLNSKIAKIVREESGLDVGESIFGFEEYDLNNTYINSLAGYINTELGSLFSFVNNNPSTSLKDIYNNAYDSDNDYSETFSHLDTRPSVEVDIPSTSVDPPIEYYDITGNLVSVTNLNQLDISIENPRFKLGAKKNFDNDCQEDFINIAFDLCWTRFDKVEADYPSTVNHPFSDQLNSTLNRLWHLEISDILRKYVSLDDEVNHESGGSHYQYASFEIDIDNESEFWDEVSELTGIDDINNLQYAPNHDYDDYLEIKYRNNIYVISYQETSSSNKEIYLADFVLKNTEDVNGDPSNKEFGFERNITISGSYKCRNLTSNSGLFSDYYLANNGSGFNIEPETLSSNQELFDYIRSELDHATQNGLEFEITSNSSPDTELNINYNATSLKISAVNILPDSLEGDQCCRTYVAVFERDAYDPDTKTGSPFSNIDWNTFTSYFGNSNRQIVDNGLQQDYICSVTGDTLAHRGITSLESSAFCIEFIPHDNLVLTSDDVYAATVSDFSDDWGDQTSTVFVDDYSNGTKGRWIGHKSYVYKNPIEHASAFTGANNDSYDEKGLLKYYASTNNIETKEYDRFVLYNWGIEEVNDPLRWISQSEITSINKNNQPEEEESIIGLNSSVLYSQNDLKPIMYANNAKKEEIFYSSGDCEIVSTHIDYGHSGEGFYYFEDEFEDPLEFEFTFDNNKEYILRYWQYIDLLVSKSSDPLNLEIHSGGSNVTYSSFQNPITTNSIIKVGNWELIEVEITPTLFAPLSATVKLVPTGISHVDDIIMYPSDATVKSISYNCGNDRIEAEFDTEHFATFFDYDYKGRLIRKKKETYRGIKNIAETYYNTPKIDVNTANGSSSQKRNTKPSKHVPFDRKKYNNNNTIKIGGGKEGSGVESDFDIFDVEINTDGVKTKLFNADTDKLIEEIDSLKTTIKNYKMDSLNKDLNIKEIKEIESLNKQLKDKYNQLDSLDVPDIKLDTNGIREGIYNDLEQKAIENGNHEKSIRKNK